MAKPHTSGEHQASERAERMIASALRTLEAEAGGVAALAAAIRDGLGRPFAAAVELIRGAKGRLIVTGMGKSGHIGRKIAATFASTGAPAFFVHPSEASHGDLGMITADDLIMALSWSGETVELKDLIDYSRRFRIGLIGITANGESTLAKSADVALVLPKAREACPHNLAPTTSALMQLALGDALAVALLESRGFTALDFRALHPGGRLGAQLKFVADIITDGDLRRHMRPDLLDARVEEIMTPRPKTVRPDQLVSEALELLNASNITALMVVDAEQPVGIVHFHDLLRAGVA
jgi:arabinose-5-phosphate isomerase